ncbi:MAG: tRNA guanosine(34) transglycosylase Tgt [Acidobacteriota bacterium]|nr:tRNA guanosine(34) transglycosylase Tgt [Acidobacteriota bacterium]
MSHPFSNFKFEITARDPSTCARAGRIITPHGMVETPVFMPVGTSGSVKALTQGQLEEAGAGIILGNTYHLHLRPGEEVIRRAGGLHRFISWPHPILTDSGGFQVMSLKGLQRITEEGVEFRSHLDGSAHFFTPERVVDIQNALGSDIAMILDECVPYPSSPEATRRAVDLTRRWAERAKARHADAIANGTAAGVLYGIIQGGLDEALRKESVAGMRETGFDGYAIGGLSVGEPRSATYDIAELTAAFLPDDQPRYLMGVGSPRDIVECVARGVDQFDCVMPTRNARNACAFTSEGRITIKAARYAEDLGPLDPSCACAVCRRYSRAYLRHLFRAGEMLGPMLTTYHNVFFYLDIMAKMRQAIAAGNFGGLLSRIRQDS